MDEVGDVVFCNIPLALHVKQLEDVPDVVLLNLKNTLQALSEIDGVHNSFTQDVGFLEDAVQFDWGAEEPVGYFGEGIEGYFVALGENDVDYLLGGLASEVQFLGFFFFDLLFECLYFQ